MIQHQGVWLPDGETHLVEWMDKAGELVDGKGTYQIKKYREALLYVRSYNLAIDVGAHCGLWSMQMAKVFKQVHAFEPVLAHRDCFRKNLQPIVEQQHDVQVMLHDCALGDHEDWVSIYTAPTSSGDSWVKGKGDIPMICLDSLGLPKVDFIKIDTEGHELFVLRGAEETVRRSEPCIIVEQKPGHGKNFGIGDTEACALLHSWGAKLRAERAGDYIFSWD